MKKRIGILGGTFNPPHMGHLILAQEALQRLRLDKVIFIPARIPPHKHIKDGSAAARYRMTCLACKGNPRLEVSQIELKRKTISYSVETLRALRKRYEKEAAFFFITGSDSVRELKSWKDIKEVMRLSNFVIAARPGFPASKFKDRIRFIDMPAVDISSSMIRRRVRASRSIRYLVPESVRRFIVKHRLYM